MTANELMMTFSGVPDATWSSANAPVSEPISFSMRSAGLNSLRAAFLVSLRASSVSDGELLTSVGSGPTLSESWASYDPDLGCLKTRQRFLTLNLDGPSMESSVDWPKSGMMCSGNVFPQPSLVRAISGNESGFWLPTPTARDWKDTPGMSKSKGGRNRMDQLPRRIYALEKSRAKSGIINPAFSLWLMGFPPGWLDSN
ncbi:MAG TPA: hypothetical protein VFW05_13205 [Verrucomicrobiae bacterium]|nr:hypothetical protein [Verrucomicrobiae bacterium]